MMPKTMSVLLLLAAMLVCVSKAPAQVTPGSVYEFDASLDTGGDAVWDNTGSFGFETMTFVSGTPTATQVSDGTLNLFAFGDPADGVSNAYEQSFGGSQLSRQDATFEVWFKPADLSTASQIIWETGGSGRGTMLTLSNDNLEFLVNGGNDNLTLATTLSDTKWHQFVGVVNNTRDSTANDTIDLYLNGAFVSSSAMANIDDWAGGNQGGLANFGGLSFPSGGQVVAGSEVDFAGDLHLYRYYNSALSPTEIFNNYDVIVNPPSEWNIDAGGNWSATGNWNGPVPGVGGQVGRGARFGSAITAPATVTLDVAVDLGYVTFENMNSFTIAGGTGSLTLSGSAQVIAEGTHEIAATILGSAGLTKTGPGTAILSGQNTFSGTVSVRQGVLSVEADSGLGNASNTIEINGGQLQITGTTLNTFTRSITMAGSGSIDVADENNSVNLTGVLSTGAGTTLNKRGAGELTLSNAAGFDGNIGVFDGKLKVTSANGLGTTTGTTTVQGGTQTGVLELAGGVTVTGETLRLGGREFAAESAVALASTGTATWDGDIVGTGGGTYYNIESQAGLLTLSGDITAPDGFIEHTIRLTGAGDGRITGAILDNDGVNTFNDDINVLKEGTGTWTIATASGIRDDYHKGTTTIAEGRLAVASGIGDIGELDSSEIRIQSGAVFDVSDFGTYNLQAGQRLAGSGSIDAGGSATVGYFDDNSINPGDAIGTLAVAGNLNLSTFNDSPTGSLNYELSSSVAGANDLVAASGNLNINRNMASNQFAVNVTPVDNTLATGSYPLITYGGSLSGSATGSNFTTRILDVDGNPMAIRQSVAVDTSGTAGQVELDVVGAAGSLTWTGTANSNWDVDNGSGTVGSANWTGAGMRFLQLDNVLFNDTAANKNVTINDNVQPGSVSINTNSTYSFEGTGGIRGGAGVAVSGSGTVKLNNTGNDYTGDTTVAAGSRLEITSASTGSIVNSGTISIGGVGVSGAPIVTAGLELNYDAAQDRPGDSVWNDVQPAAGEVNLNFANGNALTTPVSDPTFPNLSAAYNMSTTGAAIAPGSENNYIGSRAMNDGTFEVVFNVSNTAAGNEQVLLDIGADRGVSLVLDGNTLKAGVNGDATNTTGFTSTLSTGWHQAVVVIGATNPPNGSNDSFALYVDNVLVGSFDTVDIDQYAGANSWGVGGGPGANVKDPTNGTNQNLAAPMDYHGDIAIVRYYQAKFDSSDVDQNYQALLDPTQFVGPAAITVNGDFTQDPGSTLEIDLYAGIGNDLVSVTGTFTAGGNLDISLVGPDPLLGETFQIFDAAAYAGAFGNINLPGDPADWNTSQLLIDGTLTFGAVLPDGDFNDDGEWDCADIDALTEAIASMSTDLSFDMNGDGMITLADITDEGTGWLAVGGANNAATGGNAFLSGDANLDGSVDVSDFNIWNGNKFTPADAWCSGDFNANGSVDVSDFNIWNGNKFTSSMVLNAVPEPGTGLVTFLGLFFLALARMRR